MTVAVVRYYVLYMYKIYRYKRFTAYVNALYT